MRWPNDNAHLERFNRTLQTEVDLRWPQIAEINQKLPVYLKWYNEERHHFGLNLETPLSVIKCFQAINLKAVMLRQLQRVQTCFV